MNIVIACVLNLDPPMPPDLTTPGGLVTPRVQRPLVEVPRHHDFPGPCFLGVSMTTTLPLTNRTPFGLVCRLRLAGLTHDSHPLPAGSTAPFEVKPKVSLGPGAADRLPVSGCVYVCVCVSVSLEQV